MQENNETGLQVGEFIQSERFAYGRTAERDGEEIVLIGYKDELDLDRAEAIYKVVSVTPRPLGFSGNFRGDLVVARRMLSLTDEGNEVIEFILGGNGVRSISSVAVLGEIDEEDDDEIGFSPE